jgi:hypothetical protein
MSSITFEQLQREIDEAERYLRSEVTQTRTSSQTTEMKQREIQKQPNRENPKIVRNYLSMIVSFVPVTLLGNSPRLVSIAI